MARGCRAWETQCPWCGSIRAYWLDGERVRCDDCCKDTDYYEAHKKWKKELSEVITKEQLL